LSACYQLYAAVLRQIFCILQGIDMDNFSRCVTVTLSQEGDFSGNSSDPGNWTGGAVGRGILRGTKFGISAAAYPLLDIASLTESDAESIYRRDYWSAVAGDELPYAIGLVAFDAAVNAGPRRAISWLQLATGIAADGVLGDVTRATLKAADPLAASREALVRRLEFSSRLPTWSQFGLGWTRRIISLATIIAT
jgi:lysozyme family protein